jgi:hypothetical protein
MVLILILMVYPITVVSHILKNASYREYSHRLVAATGSSSTYCKPKITDLIPFILIPCQRERPSFDPDRPGIVGNAYQCALWQE